MGTAATSGIKPEYSCNTKGNIMSVTNRSTLELATIALVPLSVIVSHLRRDSRDLFFSHGDGDVTSTV
jgi:hypothetical protein